MPWNESNLMNERIKFVARLLDGESMAAVCREFGITKEISPALSQKKTG
jgi:putative transposase